METTSASAQAGSTTVVVEARRVGSVRAAARAMIVRALLMYVRTYLLRYVHYECTYARIHLGTYIMNVCIPRYVTTMTKSAAAAAAAVE